MLRPLLLCLTLCLAFIANAQRREIIKPDYAAIKKATADKSSAYYYPPLLERYKKNDTTLSADEYRYLYYGWFYNKPKREIDESELESSKKLSAIMAKDAPTREEKREALVLATKYVENSPFDLRRLSNIYRLKTVLGDSAGARPYYLKVKQLINTIVHSGDGKTDETGFHIIDVSHEYFMLNVFGYEHTSQTLTEHPCDYLALKSNEDNVEGIYFDVTQIFEGYNDMFKDVGKDFLKDMEKKNKKKKK